MSTSRITPQPVAAAHERLVNSGLIVKFTGQVLKETFSGRVLRFTGETVRQAGVLIVSSTLFIWGLIFIIGLQCGIEGAYLLQSQGAPQYAGLLHVPQATTLPHPSAAYPHV